MDTLMSSRARVVTGRLAVALACLAGVSAAAQDLPAITEVVEVRVVNVDVVVSDAEGRPVHGLERQDFELSVNGRPMAIDYFNSYVEGLPYVAGATGDSVPE